MELASYSLVDMAKTMPKAPEEPFSERNCLELPLKGRLVSYRTVA